MSEVQFLNLFICSNSSDRLLSPKCTLVTGDCHLIFTMEFVMVINCCRYNDFTHDPLSACNCTPPYSAENAISARSDLNPANGTYAFDALGHRSHGGTDAKVCLMLIIVVILFIGWSIDS